MLVCADMCMCVGACKKECESMHEYVSGCVYLCMSVSTCMPSVDMCTRDCVLLSEGVLMCMCTGVGSDSGFIPSPLHMKEEYS